MKLYSFKYSGISSSLVRSEENQFREYEVILRKWDYSIWTWWWAIFSWWLYNKQRFRRIIIF